ncbi:uncharacterized protein PAC_06222 [Phialocephala subalpina]|uniref:BTB domain-containing protein n=1 Tax=Phialocephala subalpina TaxID=576137 RepID=A0A1L7WU74_9HELO|nr:uncharacterized protein PAC_06222 [Phialocephala subalpina]
MSSTAKDKGPISGLAAVSASLLETGLYSDLTIKCQGRIWKAHRNVVFLQSKPLAAHLSGAFKESETGEIDLPDDDPKTLDRLIQFLYKETFDDEPTFTGVLAANQDSRLITCTKVYILAEKYDIPASKELAKSKFEKAIATDWNDGSLAAILEMIYTELPEFDCGLKDVALKATSEHIEELVDRGEFADVCKQNGEIAFDVIKGCLEGKNLTKSMGICPQCGQIRASSVSWQYNTKKFYCGQCGRTFA